MGGNFQARDCTDADWNNWRWQLRNSLSGQAGFEIARAALGFDENAVRSVIERYPFRVTPYYLSLCGDGEGYGPVGVQCVPVADEMRPGPGDQDDPFNEQGLMPVPGLVHRYRDRAVLIATSECAVYCRHCTRKNTLPVAASCGGRGYFEPMLDYVSRTRAVREVIVSGGDPLLLDLSLLDWLLGSLRRIEHVEVLRVGTRLPVVLPMRIDTELCALLARHRPLWLNTQFNHPAELTREAVDACGKMVESGIPVSNQCVLLKGVNDEPETMKRLCRDLQKSMIRPYYVFLCDPVSGTGHLRTSTANAVAMREQLRKELGGLAMPRFVEDVADEPAKREL